MRITKSADGTPIAYDRVGAGPALVLVGGAFSDRHDPVLTGLAAALAGRFTVYTYDRRGRGDSGDTLPYAVIREVDDLDALVEEAGGEAFVFGGSSGAALALEAAADDVAIVRLAVFEPPYVTDPARAWPDSERELSELVRAGRRSEAVALFMTRGAELPPEIVAHLMSLPTWPQNEALAHTLAYEAAVIGPGPVPAERFAKVATPTLVLAGTESSARMRDAALAVAGALPDARLHELAGQSHGRLDVPGLAGVLTAFFAG